MVGAGKSEGGGEGEGRWDDSMFDLWGSAAVYLSVEIIESVVSHIVMSPPLPLSFPPSV
jgi:hypothetical protein